MKICGSLFLWIVSPIIFLFALQAGCFLFILQMDPKIDKADAVMVFCGSLPRIKTGYDLAEEDRGKHLVLSPATDRQIRIFDRKYGLPPSVDHIRETKARTTFENGYYARKIIEEKGLKSVILVTSDYHMPRSYILLWLQVLGKGVTILPHPVAGNRFSGSFAKLLYNEMLELWGSLGEYLLYVFRGELPKTAPKSHPAVRSIKSFLLFDVKPGY